MSFFSEETQQERARIVEERHEDADKILSIRQQVAEDIAERARLAYIADGSVSEVEGHATMDGFVRGKHDAAEYQDALRETEAYVAESFAGSDSEVTVICTLSSHDRATGRWINNDAMETERVTTVTARATFEPPLI